jgi:hypothetical protein
MGRIGTRLFFASLFLTGCGSVKDSGAIDAATDVMTVDADESGNVTVTTKGALFGQSFAAAAADVDLFSHFPNHTTQLATGKTDGSGGGSIKAVPGGSVTAIYKHTVDMGFEAITFVGVKPGDTVEFANRQPQFICNVGCTNNNPIGNVTYNWTLQPGSTRTIVSGACITSSIDAPTATTARDEQPSCAQNPIDTLFVAFTGTAITGCTTRQNVAFPGPVTGGTPSGALFAVTANITGLPAEFTSVATQFAPVINNQFERNVNFATGFARANGTSSGGAFTGNFQYCNLGERTAATLTLSRPGFAQTRVIDSLPSNAATWTVASPMLPPQIETNGFLVSPSQRRAAWAVSPTAGTTHDAVVATFSWNVNIAGVSHTSFWHFVMPPGTTEVTFPKLPATFDAFLPQPDFGLGINFIRNIEIPTISSYDAYRAQGAATALCPECAVRSGDIQRAIFSGF